MSRCVAPLKGMSAPMSSILDPEQILERYSCYSGLSMPSSSCSRIQTGLYDVCLFENCSSYASRSRGLSTPDLLHAVAVDKAKEAP